MQPQIIHLGLSPQEARLAVILVHGRGSSGEDIAGLARAIPITDVAWLAPSAPGGSWYPARFLAPLEDNEPWLGQSLDTIHRAIGELEAAGLSPERIGLAGFSQGACLALEYAVRHPRRYAFVAALSGALIGPLGRPRPTIDLQGTPVLLACAENDAHIPASYVDDSEKALSAANAEVNRLRFPGGDHTIYSEELAWLDDALQA